MKIIKIKEIYPDTIDHQEYCVVTDDVNDVFVICNKTERATQRKEYRYKAQYSLNYDNGIENAILVYAPSAEDVFFEQLKKRELWDAIRKLTKKQYRRFIAFYDLNLSYAEIARMEKVDPKSIKESIEAANKKIKKILEIF